MNSRTILGGFLLLGLMPHALLAQSAQPPFTGTSFLHPNIVIASDATSFVALSPKGSGLRTNFDRRVAQFRQINVWLFDAIYADGSPVEVQVNTEFAATEAHIVGAFYARAIGQLPKSLRSDVREIWIHRGNEAFGGGNNSILIHTGSLAEGYIRDGFLEEILMHEATHTSLDGAVASSSAWLAAQRSDATFISDYAQQNPTREDVAETFNAWFALRHRSHRIPSAMQTQIRSAIPARLAALDALNLELNPALTKAKENDNYWITGLGRLQGNELLINDALFSTGAAFGTNFNPGDVRRSRWGTLRFRFHGCNDAEVTWTSSDPAFGSGGYRLNRIAPNAAQRSCEANPNSAPSNWVAGTWFGGGARSGEGFFVDVLEGGQVFVAWFTYGTAR